MLRESTAPGALAVFTCAALLLTGCANSPGRVEARNTEVVNKVFAAVNADRYGDLDDLMEPTYVRHCQATPGVDVNTLEDFKEYLRSERATFPDGKIAILFLSAQGDRVAFWGTYTGTQKGRMGPHAATGRQIQVDIAGVHRLSEGRIAETWITWDNLTALQQLKLLPPLPSAQLGEGEG